MTMPDYPSTAAVPAPQANDPKLVVGGAEPNSPMQYLDWNRSRHTARLSGAWWVDTDAAGKSRLTLRIDYLDPSGEGWTASRRGTEFTLRRAANGAVASDRTTEVVSYQDWQQQAWTARLPGSAASTSPSQTRTSTPVEAVRPNGPYVILDPAGQALAPRTSTTLDVDASAGGAARLATWSVEVTYDPTVLDVNGCQLVFTGNVCSAIRPAQSPHRWGHEHTRSGPATLARVTFSAVGSHGAATTVGVKVLSVTEASGAKLTAMLGSTQIQVK
ncbi:MAG: hypothetical protein JOZ87_40805 [Chloroflexi bacterium]|nr:hypothetical protein [Chloroflexota bacterium]